MGEMRYWNPILETMPRDRVVEIQMRKFRRVLGRTIQNSPMYQEKLKDHDIRPEAFKNMDDLLKLPLTEKHELREAQECEGPYLYGQTLGPEVTDICTMHQTSGTTGRPLYVPDSYRSWQWRIEPWTSMLYMMGLRETDRVFIPFGYNIYYDCSQNAVIRHAEPEISHPAQQGFGLSTAASLSLNPFFLHKPFENAAPKDSFSPLSQRQSGPARTGPRWN